MLSVGVTGHRADMIPAGTEETLRNRIVEALALIASAGAELLENERECFAVGPGKLRFISPIADGADQIAAEVALELGWELQLVLPFERSAYRASLANHGARERFDALVERAACLLELPGDPDHGLDAYVMTGRATVAHCDILIAAWDGLPPRGRGGTGEVVQFALSRGTAIIHVPLVPGGDTRICGAHSTRLWSRSPTIPRLRDQWNAPTSMPFCAVS